MEFEYLFKADKSKWCIGAIETSWCFDNSLDIDKRYYFKRKILKRKITMLSMDSPSEMTVREEDLYKYFEKTD